MVVNKAHSHKDASDHSVKSSANTVSTHDAKSDETMTKATDSHPTKSSKEEDMSADVIDVTPEAEQIRAIQLHNQPSLSVWNPPDSGEIEIVGTIQDGGVRPIGASHLEIVGTLLTNRPIMASHLRIFEMVDNRPVFCDDFKMLEGQGFDGRPVMASDPDLMTDNMVFGQRPIASNAIDDAPAMMGFID